MNEVHKENKLKQGKRDHLNFIFVDGKGQCKAKDLKIETQADVMFIALATCSLIILMSIFHDL